MIREVPNLYLGLVKQKQEYIPKGYKRQTNEYWGNPCQGSKFIVIKS